MVSDDLKPHLTITETGVTAKLRHPGKFTPPDNAPARYSIGRMLQFSTFKNWLDLSSKTFALFDSAAQLPPDADLSARIKTMAALGHQQAKAIAALALVQDTIRYVYTGMDGGNYVPALSRNTWERRFGDCKGKSALLLGILRELGIEAEAVLVSTHGGDGYNHLLPSPDLFDHVLLRTMIDGRRYWLDGTRTGDPHLMTDDEIVYRWVLPLGANGHDLQKIGYQPPRQPQETDFFEIDATGGTDLPANVKLVRVLRGDQALATYLALKAQTRVASRDNLMAAFKQGWLTTDDAGWKFDPGTGGLSISVSGTIKLDWEKDDDGPNLAIVGGGFYPPARRERPGVQDQNAPYANTPGSFKCSVTRMHLPKLSKGHWETGADKIDQVIGGVAYYRQVNLRNGTIDLVRSSRTQVEEISPAEAEVANVMIPKFDNSKVTVWTYKGNAAVSEITDPNMPDLAAVDWLRDGSTCLPQRER
ncbi:MAG: transglutaminase domain-containing protein [Sphingobacteriales bacterium]|nr:MAG: transglutaminase domain-containing protein [Sphingobacteriales bacterium]